jgi:N6-adenosine-specific RNA methylase IME4
MIFCLERPPRYIVNSSIEVETWTIIRKYLLDIIINPEYEKYVYDLSEEDYNELKQSIQEYGLYNPIIVNQNGIVLDGHHRLKAVKELGLLEKIEPINLYRIRPFFNPILEELYVIDVNLARRHLTKFQRGELVLKKYSIQLRYSQEKKKRKDLIEESISQPVSANVESADLEDSSNNGYAIDAGGISHPSTITTPTNQIDILAKKTNMSDATLRKVQFILKHGSDHLIQSVRDGYTSISYAYKCVKRSLDHKNTPDLPEGQFDIILADPPWKYDFNMRGSPDDHYGVMEDYEIGAMHHKLPIADNAILFLWATAPKLPEALRVMKDWGFEYKTNAVWIKNMIGTGYYFRGQHELLLVGKKGDEIPVPEEKNRHSSVIESPRLEHSEKPTLVYGLIEKMYPNRSYLELFARGSKRKGWTQWGNEELEEEISA